MPHSSFTSNDSTKVISCFDSLRRLLVAPVLLAGKKLKSLKIAEKSWNSLKIAKYSWKKLIAIFQLFQLLSCFFSYIWLSFSYFSFFQLYLSFFSYIWLSFSYFSFFSAIFQLYLAIFQLSWIVCVGFYL